MVGVDPRRHPVREPDEQPLLGGRGQALVVAGRVLGCAALGHRGPPHARASAKLPENHGHGRSTQVGVRDRDGARLRKKDKDEGVAGARRSPRSRKRPSAELRRVYEAKLAEREILHRSKIQGSRRPRGPRDPRGGVPPRPGASHLGARPQDREWPVEARPGRLDHRAVRDDGVLGDDHDAVADVVALAVLLAQALRVDDPHAAPDARVLVDDRVLDDRVGADARRGAGRAPCACSISSTVS